MYRSKRRTRRFDGVEIRAAESGLHSPHITVQKNCSRRIDGEGGRPRPEARALGTVAEAGDRPEATATLFLDPPGFSIRIVPQRTSFPRL